MPRLHLDKNSVRYQLVIPPGWYRIAVSGDTRAHVRAAIDRAVPNNSAGEKTARVKTGMRSLLDTAVDQARAAGARDLYVPLGGMGGLAIPASFVITEIPTAGLDGDLLISEWTMNGRGTMIPVGGGRGVRTDDVFESDVPDDVYRGATRQIAYAVPLPDLGTVLLVTFSAIGDGRPDSEFTNLLVDLFDAMMSTLRIIRPTPAQDLTTAAGPRR